MIVAGLRFALLIYRGHSASDMGLCLCAHSFEDWKASELIVTDR